MAMIFSADGETHERLWLIDDAICDIDAIGQLCPLLNDGSLGNPVGVNIDLERSDGWKRVNKFEVSI